MQKLRLRTLVAKLLTLLWSAGGFFATLKACNWIRGLNPDSIWFFVCLLLCLANVLLLSQAILTAGAALFKLCGFSALSTRLRLPGLPWRFKLALMLTPLPVLGFWLAHAGLDLDTESKLRGDDKQQFRSDVDKLAALDGWVAGPVAAGEVYYQWGHKAFQRQDLSSAEWCWQQSLGQWLVSRLATGYGPVFELDDLGELFLLEGNINTARGFFERAVELSGNWRGQSSDQKADEQAQLKAQARLRALVGLGRICESQGDVARAAQLYEAALGLQRDWDLLERDPAAANTAILSTLYFKLGKLDLADTLMQQALYYQKQAVGLIRTGRVFFGSYSERAQTALSAYSQLLAASGKRSEAKALDAQLDKIQAAKRRELNLPVGDRDMMVDFMVEVTKKIIGIKYNTALSEAAMQAELKGQLSAEAFSELKALRTHQDWHRKGPISAGQLSDVRVDQLSLSNRKTNEAMPIIATGTAVLSPATSPDQSRFRLMFLVRPAGAANGAPLVVSILDYSDQLKHRE